MSDVPDNELYTAQGVLEDAPFGIHVYQLTSDERLIFLGSNATASRIPGIDHHPFVGKTIEEAFPALVETEIPIRYRAVRLREPMPRQVTGLLAVDRISLEPSRCAAGAVSLPRFGGHPERGYSPRCSTNAAEKITPRFIQERRRSPDDGARFEDDNRSCQRAGSQSLHAQSPCS